MYTLTIMNKKVIILLAVLFTFLLLSGPVSAKEDVNIKVKSEGAFIIIKLYDGNGKPVSSSGKIHYNISDQNGNYKWAKKAYSKLHGIKFSPGIYSVVVKFDGDSKRNPAEFAGTIIVSYGESSFDPYTYYDSHNWGLNQKMDDYLEYNYWDEELYDDPYTYDGEGP